MQAPRQPTVRDLLEHACFVRGLARALVRPDLEDDLVQEVWLRALERPPGDSRRPRGWLATVLRRALWMQDRGEGRRRRREAAVARPETTAASDAVVEREEMLRRVTDAVLDLEPRDREVVLLRFYQDLPPREIARRLELSPEVARGRLHRALQRLRARLEADSGGDRSWLSALAGLPALPVTTGAGTQPAAALIGAWIMSAKTKIAGVLSLMLVLGGGALWWSLASREQQPPLLVGSAEVMPPRPKAVPENREEIRTVPFRPEEAERVHQDRDGSSQVARVHGRVVDDRRRPVAGARVQLCQLPAEPVITSTDREGRFSFSSLKVVGGLSERAGLHVTHDLGAAAMGIWRVEAKERDVGTLVLSLARDLVVLVQDAERPAPGVTVTLSLRSGGLDRRITGDRGRVVFPQVPGGAYILQAVRGIERRAAKGVSVPEQAKEPVVLALGPTRPVEVSVVTRDSTDPIAGARIELWAHCPLPGTPRMVYEIVRRVDPTDAAGRTRLEGIGAEDRLYLGVTAEGFISKTRNRSADVEAGEERVRVELDRLRTVSVPVVAGECPPPPDGTVVWPRARPGSGVAPPESARMRGTHLVVSGIAFPFGSFLAAAPDGSLASVRVPERGPAPPIAFRRPRSVTVLVRETDGKRVEGCWIEVRGTNNNPLGPPVKTGVDGVARIQNLEGRTANVFLTATAGARLSKFLIGTVDLESGNAELEATVQPERKLIVEVTIGGEPRLPPTYSLYLGNATEGAVEEDATRAELRLPLRPLEPLDPIYVLLEAPGFLPAKASTLSSNDGPTRVRLDLEAASTITVHVTPPPDGMYGIDLQEWLEIDQRWPDCRRSFGNVRLPGAAEGTITLRTLPVGRYRLRDEHSGLVGESFQVSGGATSEVGFDLSTVGWLRGTVEAPPGHSVAGAVVEISGDGISKSESDPGGLRSSKRRVGADARFWFRIPGDRPVRVQVTHPLLMPDPERGVRTVQRPREDLVLCLISGPCASLRLAPRPRSLRGVLLLLFEDGDGDQPASEHEPVPVEGGYAFGGFEPGTYTLWFDVRKFAPYVKRDLALGLGTTDLGTFALDPGTSIKVTILTDAGTAPPRISVFAWRLEEPTYTRYINSDGESEVVVPGLGPGRFLVVIDRSVGGQARVDEHTVESDGKQDIHLVFDARNQ